MGRGLPFFKAERLPGRFIRLLVSMTGLVSVIPSGHAADPSEQARLEQEVRGASKPRGLLCSSRRLEVRQLASTILRAVAPIGTIFRPPEVPVVHLSPGSPDYRRVVGEMMYCFSLYASLQQRLTEFVAEQKAGGALPGGGALPVKGITDDEDLCEETHRIESELDNARAGYGRACGWAWPYVNLRPMCRQPGFEATTILNPFLPVPKIRLSEASPDYKETVAAPNTCESKIGNAKARLKDLWNDRKSAAEAAATLNGRLLDEKVLLGDYRLAQMSEIYQQLKPALKRCARTSMSSKPLLNLGAPPKPS